MDTTFDSGGLALRAHVGRPARASGTTRPGLVLCHGFPAGPRGAATSAETHPELADRLAAASGWVVLAFNLRGTGESEGDFSVAGWIADLRAAVAHLQDTEPVGGVWLAGFGTGGALAICATGEDTRVRGVATVAAPADFSHWSADPARFLEACRDGGLIRDHAFPPDPEAWAREFSETRPLALVGKIPPRPLCIIHGSQDEVVPVAD
ncbi:MAG: alpha/beta hydrolase, partial [Acidimicrobiales bacterium]